MPSLLKTALKRRFLFGGVAVASVSGGAASAALDPGQEVGLAAGALSSAMERMHGGRWRTVVDHRNGFVMVIADRSRGKRAT